MNPERTSHPSMPQVETLIDFLEKKPGLAKGFAKNQSAKQAANKDWERIAIILNSMGGGAIKTAKKWMKYWSDKKNAVKKKAAARAASRNVTGGGVVEDLPELSIIEERIVCLMGGESFATGDRHLQIQPFDEPSQPIQDHDSPSVLAPLTQASLSNSTLQAMEINYLDASVPFDQVINTTDVNISIERRDQSQCMVNLPVQETEIQVAEVSFTPTRPNEPLGANDMTDVDRRPVPATNLTQQQQRPQHEHRRSSPSDLYSRRRPRRRILEATRRNAQTSPPSQRRANLMGIAEKFLRVEQQRLDLESRMVALMEGNSERERLLLEATKAMGEGLKALAEAIKR